MEGGKSIFECSKLHLLMGTEHSSGNYERLLQKRKGGGSSKIK